MAKINKEEYELLISIVFYWKWLARDRDGYGQLMDISKKAWESKEFFERLSNNYYKELKE